MIMLICSEGTQCCYWQLATPGSWLGDQPRLQDEVLKVCHFHQRQNCLVDQTAGGVTKSGLDYNMHCKRELQLQQNKVEYACEVGVRGSSPP